MKPLLPLTLCFLLVSGFGTSEAQNFWQPTNGPYGGTAMTMVTNSQGTIFAGSDNGIFRSTNNGDLWVKVFPDTVDLFPGVRALARDSSNNIYAGTASGKAYKSIDNGFTWMELGPEIGSAGINALAVNPAQHVFAATTQGMFRSTNMGTSWTQVNSGLTSTAVNAIAIFPTSELYVGTSGGVFRSTNNGDLWVGVNSGLPSGAVNTLALGPSRTLDGSLSVYAGLVAGVFYYNALSGNWNPLLDGLTTLFVYALLATPNGELFAATFGGGLFRLLLAATTWTQVNTGILPYVYIAALAATGAGVLFAAADWGGIFRSTNNGANWISRSAGLTAYIIHAIYVAAALNAIFMGTNTGFFRSIDGGLNWSLIQHPDVFFWVTAIAATSLYLYAGTYFQGMWRSSDGGASWTQINNGLTNLFITALAINALGHLYAGTLGGGVFSSKNNGGTWNPVNTGLNHLLITALMLAPGGILFAGTNGGGVYRFDSGAGNWTQVAVGLVVLAITALAYDALGNIYAATNGGGIFRSGNLGVLWLAVNTGLAYLAVDHLIHAQDSREGGGVLYAAAGGTVFRSINSGSNWEHFASGLSGKAVARLAADSSHVFAGTFGDGVYRGGGATSIRESGENPVGFSLDQNYPNPFNPVTSLRFGIPFSTPVSLEVFDLLGRKIATLVNETLEAGTHLVNFDANGISSGTYYYRLKAGSFLQVKKMVMLR